MFEATSCCSFDVDGTLVLQDYVAKVRRLQVLVSVLTSKTFYTTDIQRAFKDANAWYEREASCFAASDEVLWLHYARSFAASLRLSDNRTIVQLAAFFHDFSETSDNFLVPYAARAFVRELAVHGIRLFVISANVRAVQRLEIAGLKSAFERVLTPAPGAKKEELFAHLLREEGIAATELVHIGDDPYTDGEIPGRLGIPAFVLFDLGDRERHSVKLAELLTLAGKGYQSLFALFREGIGPARYAQS